jgi:hypothetical protein
MDVGDASFTLLRPFLSKFHHSVFVRWPQTRLHMRPMKLFLILLGMIGSVLPVSAADETIWNVKAVHPEGRLLDIKAIDKSGGIHAVKAIQEGENYHVIDVKALVGNARLPVKILVGDTPLAPVKAIAVDGTIIDIKAIAPDGEKLDVKGVSRAGNILNIKALAKDGKQYGVKAISPDGHLYDIKGIKMNADKVEGKVNGVEFHAHIKALPQVPGSK